LGSSADALNAATLLARWESIPAVDASDLRRDLDSVILPAV
jgi:hypothetical protein